MYWMFAFAMCVYAFFLSTFIKTTWVAYTISYAFVLFAVLLNLILSNSLLMYFIFFNTRGDWYTIALRYLFYLYPPFALSILFGIIAWKASSHFVENEMAFIPGTYFGWKDLALPEIGEFTQGDYYHSPTPLNCFAVFFLLIVGYSILVWYFDHVIPDNRGTNEPFYFFLQRKYW